MTDHSAIENSDNSGFSTRRKAIMAGSIALLTGTVAGSLFLSASGTAVACDNPPCTPPPPSRKE